MRKWQVPDDQILINAYVPVSMHKKILQAGDVSKSEVVRKALKFYLDLLDGKKSGMEIKVIGIKEGSIVKEFEVNL